MCSVLGGACRSPEGPGSGSPHTGSWVSLKGDVAVNSDQLWRHRGTRVPWRLRCCGLAAGWVHPEALEMGSAAGGAGQPVVATVSVRAQL